MPVDQDVIVQETALPEVGHPPTIADVAHLKPRDLIGLLFVSCCLALTAIAIGLSLTGHPVLWITGQIILAFALLQWFVLIHDAGHKTLFRTSAWNKCVGHLASFFALIPFECWKAVHGIHHRWTGWQDLDVTTSALVPRQLSRPERIAVNVCWKLWIPLFSILYRVSNYWNPWQLFRLFPRSTIRRRLAGNMVLLISAYAAVTYLVGVVQLLQVAGGGLLLTLVMQDPLILSQHTHITMNHSHGHAVHPYAPTEQQRFTRSLTFPSWFARLVLINLNAHELHHMYSQVPGYLLHRIDYQPHNTVAWWRWLRKAKRVPGEVFLFQNRSQTGFDL